MALNTVQEDENDTTENTSIDNTITLTPPTTALSSSSHTAQQSLGTALTNLMTTFNKEAENQAKLFEIFENERNNKLFANNDNCLNWKSNEVCFWLQKIKMDEYINYFYNDNINGNYLLNKINKNILINKYNIKDNDCQCIMDQIKILKDHIGFNNNDNDIKIDLKNDKNTSILSTTIKQSEYELKIEEYKDEIFKLKKENEKLRDGYINLETHYEKQLKNEMTKTKNLELKMLNNIDINEINKQNSNDQLSLLWDENEQLSNKIKTLKDSIEFLENDLKKTKFELFKEKQQKKLLENQTHRLTLELTKYLNSPKYNVDVTLKAPRILTKKIDITTKNQLKNGVSPSTSSTTSTPSPKNDPSRILVWMKNTGYLSKSRKNITLVKNNGKSIKEQENNRKKGLNIFSKIQQKKNQKFNQNVEKFNKFIDNTYNDNNSLINNNELDDNQKGLSPELMNNNQINNTLFNNNDNNNKKRKRVSFVNKNPKFENKPNFNFDKCDEQKIAVYNASIMIPVQISVDKQKNNNNNINNINGNNNIKNNKELGNGNIKRVSNVNLLNIKTDVKSVQNNDNGIVQVSASPQPDLPDVQYVT